MYDWENYYSVVCHYSVYIIKKITCVFVIHFEVKLIHPTLSQLEQNGEPASVCFASLVNDLIDVYHL